MPSCPLRAALPGGRPPGHAPGPGARAYWPAGASTLGGRGQACGLPLAHAGLTPASGPRSRAGQLRWPPGARRPLAWPAPGGRSSAPPPGRASSPPVCSRSCQNQEGAASPWRASWSRLLFNADCPPPPTYVTLGVGGGAVGAELRGQVPPWQRPSRLRCPQDWKPQREGLPSSCPPLASGTTTACVSR